MANSNPTHPTDRAANAARRRTARNAARREIAVWGLVLTILCLLIASILLFNDRSPEQPVSNEAVAKVSEDTVEKTADEPALADKKTLPAVNTPRQPQSDGHEKPTKSKVEKEENGKPFEPMIIRFEPATEPRVADNDRDELPATTDSQPSKSTIEPDPQPLPRPKLVEAQFLTKSLPLVNPGTIAPSKPVVLLEFPRVPEDVKIRILGLDQFNAKFAAQAEPSAKLVVDHTDSEQTLTVRDELGGEDVATFFLQKRELRFRWKPRLALAGVQQQLRDYCVLHLNWKGHPGRYYALHDLHVRGERQVEEQQVRLRASELPTNLDPKNLYIGAGKLEIADIYSHRFLTTPLSQRAEVPTLKRSRKDPTLFVKLAWKDRALAFQLDVPINDESETRRRRKLFEHVDGNFDLHVSLYRVVDGRIKVEELRLGTP